MGKKEEEVNKNIRGKNKQQTEQNYLDKAYRPDEEVPLTGEEFMSIFQTMKEVRDSRVHLVMDRNGDTIGQSISQKDEDVDRLNYYVYKIHKRLVDEGYGDNIETIRKEIEKQREEEQNQQPKRMEPKKADGPENEGKEVSITRDE